MVENLRGRPEDKDNSRKRTERDGVVFIGYDENDVDVEFGEAGGFNTLDTLVDYNCEELDQQERERYGRIQGGSAPGDSLENQIRIAHGIRESGNGNGDNGSSNNGTISPRAYERYITGQAELINKKQEKKKAREQRVKDNQKKKKQKANGNKGKRG